MTKINVDVDIEKMVPLLEPYDHDGERCMVWHRKGEKLNGVARNTTVTEAVAFVKGFRAAIAAVEDLQMEADGDKGS